MLLLPHERLKDYRLHTFRLLPELRLKTPVDAIEFANQRGFVYLWPITEIAMPSLWSAVAGDRPVADAHDDPGHVTWGWKDSLLGQRAWYYAKVLRKRATIISFDVAPYFYALSENYGDYAEDYLTLYEQGRMPQATKAIYEALLDHGALDTIALRKAARMTSKESESQFNKALTDLQVDFKILPVAVTDAGAWRYAFAYDIVARYYPDIPERAREVSERAARQKLVELYLKSVGAAQVEEVIKLFGWRKPNVEAVLQRLSEAGTVMKVGFEGQKGEFYAVRELAE
jgi:hypothetical protein